MRLPALLAVFTGLYSVSNAVTGFSSTSRNVSRKERVPAHPRDFTIEKRNTEIGIGEVGSDSTQIAAVGVDGCTGTFIWAGGLVFGAHTECGDETADMENLKGEVEDLGKQNDVTSVAICYPEGQTAGLQEIKDGLTWTGQTPEVTTYPYVEGKQQEFTLTAKTTSPGEVDVEVQTS